MDLTKLTISKLHKGYQQGEYTVTDITKAYLKRIKRLNPILNVYLTISEDYALKTASQLDKQLTKDKQIANKLPLFGVPTALKDIYLTKGIRTTAASKVLEDYIPQYSSTSWNKLASAGAVLLGKLNCDAWAHGGSGENSDFGPTKNPWDLTRVPGGSSSGSGVALAADMALITTGSDTGGSIRSPASFCNVVGLKPTYGRVSRYGIIAMASSTDSIGHLGKTVEDVARVLSITAGADPLDATTPDISVPAYLQHINKSPTSMTIGLPKEFLSDQLDRQVASQIDQVIKVFEKQGYKTTTISLPHTKYAIADYYIIQPSEVASNLARYDGIRYGFKRSKFGDEAKRRIMLGTYSLSSGYYDAYYKKAMRVRTLIKQDYEKVFQKVDLILAPVSPFPPFKLGEKVDDPLQMYLADSFVVSANLAGVPSLAIPGGFTNNNLPIGFQLISPQFSEQLLFQVGHAYQQVTDWHLRKPKLSV